MARQGARQHAGRPAGRSPTSSHRGVRIPSFEMRFERLGQTVMKGTAERITRHGLEYRVGQRHALLAILGFLLRVAPGLVGHPELVERGSGAAMRAAAPSRTPTRGRPDGPRDAIPVRGVQFLLFRKSRVNVRKSGFLVRFVTFEVCGVIGHSPVLVTPRRRHWLRLQSAPRSAFEPLGRSEKSTLQRRLKPGHVAGPASTATARSSCRSRGLMTSSGVSSTTRSGSAPRFSMIETPMRVSNESFGMVT